MKCEDCGRQMFKNESKCPYCGRVYGPSNVAQFIYLLIGLGLLVVGWLYWKG